MDVLYVPGFEQPINGAHRWIRIFGRGPSIQPSEVARVVFVLWVARRCAMLDGDLRSLRRGFIPTLLVGLLAGGLLFREPDLGGALLFLLCFATPVLITTSLNVFITSGNFSFSLQRYCVQAK